MRIVFLVLALLAFGGVSGYYRRRCSYNVGRNIGEKHMRERWGMEENKEYHE